MAVTWDDAVLHALSLPDTELGTSYGKPAVMIASNGRAFLFFGREPETSFGVALDLDTIGLVTTPCLTSGRRSLQAGAG